MVTASSDGAIDFGGGPLFSAGQHDLFIARLASTGEHMWSRQFGDEGYQFYSRLRVNSNDEVVVSCGVCDGAIDFGAGELTPTDSCGDVVAKISP